MRKYTSDEALSSAMGQTGSAFLDTDGTTFTAPTGTAIVAITCLTDCQFDALTLATGGTTGDYFNTANTGAGGDQFSSSDTIPAGVTIYGRWATASVNTDGQKCICYLG